MTTDPLEPRILIGDVTEQLATMPDESVHCVVTSPPYWGLRDYGTGTWDGGDTDCDHIRPSTNMNVGFNERWGQGAGERKQEKKSDGQYPSVCAKCGATRVDRQLGLEPTPEEYVARMVAVFREVRRVLRSDGTCWLNIGDSYNAYNGNRGPSGSLSAAADAARNETPRGLTTDTLKPKDLVGIPWRLAFALQADGWYLRSDIIWSKPNPMPESVTDRPTKAHEYLFLLTRSARYFYDADAIREPAEWARWGDQTTGPGSMGWIGAKPKAELRSGRVGRYQERAMYGEGDGTTPRKQLDEPQGQRNKRTVWEIATESYAEAHFATFPTKLVEPCILAGTSEKGCCPECGAPWARETEVEYDAVGRTTNGPRSEERKHLEHGTAGFAQRLEKRVQTTGWMPTCNHDLPSVSCTVLDPFLGSGTTALVARRLNRASVGIELSPEYAALAVKRLSTWWQNPKRPLAEDPGQLDLLGGVT